MAQHIGHAPHVLSLVVSWRTSAGLELASVGCNVKSLSVPTGSWTTAVRASSCKPNDALLRRYNLAMSRTRVSGHTTASYLEQDGTPISRSRSAQLMTSWGLLFRRFRQPFLKRYHDGCLVKSVEQEGTGVEVRFRRPDRTRRPVGLRRWGTLHVSQYICCLTHSRDTPATSVARRRTRKMVAPRLLATFADHFTFFQMPGSHILCYLIPGAEGEIPPRSAAELGMVLELLEEQLPDLLTDIDGNPVISRCRLGKCSRTRGRTTKDRRAVSALPFFQHLKAP